MPKIIIVKVVIENSTDTSITRTIPRGRVIEISDRGSRYQNAVVVRDYPVTLPPRTSATLYLEARCLEHWKGWPSAAQGRLTPYAFVGPYDDQQDLWKQLSENG